jgi:hypothetical protein
MINGLLIPGYENRLMSGQAGPVFWVAFLTSIERSFPELCQGVAKNRGTLTDIPPKDSADISWLREGIQNGCHATQGNGPNASDKKFRGLCNYLST